jgi:integrase
MSVYRRKNRGKKSTTYFVRFQYEGKLIRRFGFTNRKLAEEWESSERVRLQRRDRGLVRANNNAIIVPLIASYANHLHAMGRSEMYVYTTEQRLKRLCEGACWQTAGDITDSSFEAWRARPHTFHNKPVGPRTINQFLDTGKHFCAWLVKPMNILTSNPLADVRKARVVQNTFYRRSATMNEVELLMAAAPEDRRAFYQFLLYCPLRKQTLRELRWEHFDLDAERPVVRIPGEIQKQKVDQTLPIRHDIAHMLRRHRGNAKPGDAVFPVVPELDDLKADLHAAGVPFSDRGGNRRLDFHAFRRTLVTMMKRAGIGLDVAHVALGHADKRTTEKWYDNDVTDKTPLTQAIEQLPSITPMRIAKGG